MRRVVPAGFEDEESDGEDEVMSHPRGSSLPKPQQTCLLRDKARSGSSKVQRRKDYMAAREKDKKLGEVIRPQDRPENQPFYVDAVRRNLGLGSEPSIESSPLQLSNLLQNTDVKVLMSPKCTRTPKWIDSEAKLVEVQKQLKEQDELAIDFENNNEHSYLGMTALVQISSVKDDYVLDPFPTLTTLKPFLLSIMTDLKKLKIFCGGTNDFLNLRRDFELVPALCLDIQFLDKRIDGLPATSNSKGLKQLCENYLHVIIPKSETNRDWRRRPLPAEMIRYAQEDTYYTMAVYQEMKKKIILEERHHLLQEAIEDTIAMMTSVLKKNRA